MNSLVVAPPNSLWNDPDLKSNLVHALRSGGLDHAVSILDPFYPGLSDSEQCEILKARYEPQLLADGLETRAFILKEGRVVVVGSPLHTVAGFIFEAFTVRIFNEKKDSERKHSFGRPKGAG